MTSVLITGVTGFIGSNLGKRLVDQGYKVSGIVRYCANRHLQPIKEYSDKITLFSGDIANYHSVISCLRAANPDVVVHLAALSPVRHSFEQPFSYEETNFAGTMNVVHAMLDLPGYRKKKLVAASTAEVYGIQDEEVPFTEDLPLKPSSPYAVTKAAADMYLRLAAEVYELGCIICRPTNTLGRKRESGYIAEYLINGMLRNQRVYIGAPDSVRDYIHVTDHVNAYTLLIEKDVARGAVINVGSGTGVTNRDLARRIAALTGYDLRKASFGRYPPGYPQRPIASDQPYLVLNPDKVRKLGWNLKLSLDEALKRTVAEKKRSAKSGSLRQPG